MLDLHNNNIMVKLRGTWSHYCHKFQSSVHYYPSTTCAFLGLVGGLGCVELGRGLMALHSAAEFQKTEAVSCLDRKQPFPETHGWTLPSQEISRRCRNHEDRYFVPKWGVSCYGVVT